MKPLHKSLFALLLAFLSLATACSTPRFNNPAGAGKYLSEHREQLQTAAKEWLSRPDDPMLCSVGKESYRWDDALFVKKGTGYELRVGDLITEHSRLEEALMHAKVPPEEFFAWKDRMQSFDGLCMYTMPTFDNERKVGRYVVITLHGLGRFSASSYGYAYAAPGSHASEQLTSAARTEHHEFGAKTWVHEVGDGWFYYRDDAR